MKIIKLNRTFITNIALILLVCVISVICFLPEKSVPIYNGKQNTIYYYGDKNSKKISVMINVYENTDIVNGMLEVLEIYNAKATFFVGGCWADDNGETLKKIAGKGHEIGNHGYFHKEHKNLDYNGNFEEISLCGVVVKALCNVTPKLFAPPSGSYSENTLNAANNLGYKVIMWSKDTIDWRDYDEDKIYRRATEKVEGGDLILMHPKEHTLKVLPKILEFYCNNGYNIVTVSENISK